MAAPLLLPVVRELPLLWYGEPVEANSSTQTPKNAFKVFATTADVEAEGLASAAVAVQVAAAVTARSGSFERSLRREGAAGRSAAFKLATSFTQRSTE